MFRTTARWIAVFSLVILFASSMYAQCGVERWSVKTGTDSQAPSIDLSTYISSTIYNFHQSTRPASLPSNSRVAPRETNQYRLTGTLIGYKRESDSDYHLVIKDSSGRTMIIEVPSLSCVGSGSPFRSRIGTARSQFDTKLTATTSYKTVTAPVAIKGIGFWDFLHGQTGVAPNGIELHPVLDIQFTGTITSSDPNVIAGYAVAPPAATMPADVVEDNDGGRVQVFRGGDAIANILFHGGAVIEHPRLQIVFAGNFDESSRASVLQIARGINARLRFDELERYGMRNQSLATSVSSVEEPVSGNDLDVQRMLANAVEGGRLQQIDENAITVVVLDANADVAVGTTRDWLSYHSLFHPTELGMPYVVVRNVADRDAFREALLASVARTIVNPAGNAWY